MHADQFMREVSLIAKGLDSDRIERMAVALNALRERDGRLFLVGLGGSLANCIHMAADLRKLCGINAHAPDNIAELTAWANDADWGSLFTGFLSDITSLDALFVLSVGGGTNKVSKPITEAISIAIMNGAQVWGIVGPNGGATAELGHVVLRVPASYGTRVTPHTEAFQAVIWHCLVSHPLLQKNPTKW